MAQSMASIVTTTMSSMRVKPVRFFADTFLFNWILVFFVLIDIKWWNKNKTGEVYLEKIEMQIFVLEHEKSVFQWTFYAEIEIQWNYENKIYKASDFLTRI